MKYRQTYSMVCPFFMSSVSFNDLLPVIYFGLSLVLFFKVPVVKA